VVQWIGGKLASPDKEAILVCWVLHVQLHSTAGCSDPCMHLVNKAGRRRRLGFLHVQSSGDGNTKLSSTCT
jgi:hypothetical protein